MQRNALVAGLIAAAAILFGSWYLLRDSGGTAPPADAPTTTATTTGSGGGTETVSAVTSVRLAMLDTAGATSGAQRGCDRVVMVPQSVATTTAPLNAALKALFALSTTSVGGYFNFIDRTNETLRFESAEVAGGEARIYLTGSLSGLAGVCDDPRARIQIEETALQFPTVQRVAIFLNGTSTTLTPTER